MPSGAADKQLDQPTMLPRRTVSELLVDLDRTCDRVGHGRVAVASDADGTLWTCDVGEVLFEHALAKDWIGAAALTALRSEAEEFLELGVEALEHKASRDLVMALWAAYRAGTYPEHRVCEVMAWCMAGVEVDTLARECGELLRGNCSKAPLRTQWIDESIAILRWAALREVPTFVVSASPSPIVEVAVELMAAEHVLPVPRVLAMRPKVLEGRIESSLVGPAPYGEGKRVALEAALSADGRSTLLAALGDNSFDVPMLRLARLPVAVRPKRALLDAAHTVDGLIELAAG